jgi:hypothetical protein
MAERAQVTSVEAIESFRASLILYLGKARPTVEEVSNEVLRTRDWLQHDRRRYWEHELHVRGRRLEEAQQELFGAMLSKLQSVKAEQQREVHEAKSALDEAAAKLAVLKKWDRELDNRSQPLLKLVDQLLGFMTGDLVKAVAYLAQAVKTLDAYVGVNLPGASTGPGPGSPPDPPPGGAPPGAGVGPKEGDPA